MITIKRSKFGVEVRIDDRSIAVANDAMSALIQARNELESNLNLVNQHILRERSKRSTERMVGND